MSESGEALRAIEAAPPRQRHPTVILAALHYLALAGRAPAVDTLLRMTDSVAALAVRRRPRAALLEAELALGAAAPPLLRQGDSVEVLPEALARVPAGALPVVTTTWALSRFPPAKRLRFLDCLSKAADGRAVAWVSAEGVGVAPSIPALGDRPASGRSIIGLAVSDGSALPAEAIGRCWSRGRFLAWLAAS